MPERIGLSFGDQTAASKNILTQSLAETLQEIGGVSHVQIVKERADSQDAGSVLTLVLGAPAVAMFVKAIAQWLARNNQSSIVIKLPDREFTLNNLKSENIPDTVKYLSSFVGP